MIVTSIPAYAEEEIIIENDAIENTSETSTEETESNFITDILDSVIFELENAENSVEPCWGNSGSSNGHYTSAEYAGNYVDVGVENVQKMRIAATSVDNAENFKADAIKTINAKATSRYKGSLTTRDWEILQELMNNIDKILKTNMFPGSESDPESRKYKILGVAMHMIGDTCAHRTMVPADDIDNFDNQYFSEGSANQSVSTLKKWLKYSIQSDTKAEIYANRNWNVFKRSLETGCMEFRDIKFYMEPSVEHRSGKYEDNASFYPIRYTITQNACIRLLKATSLSASRKIIVPRTNRFIFNNLKNYYIRSGGATSDFDYWDEISTNSFV